MWASTRGFRQCTSHRLIGEGIRRSLVGTKSISRHSKRKDSFCSESASLEEMSQELHIPRLSLRKHIPQRNAIARRTTHCRFLSDKATAIEKEAVSAKETADHLIQLGSEQPSALQDWAARQLDTTQRQEIARLVSLCQSHTTPEPKYIELQRVAFNTAIPFVG